MGKTLLVGCSFFSSLAHSRCVDEHQIDTSKYQILASSGSGNQALAARTIYQLSLDNYDQVIVVWSGINRLDFPISRTLQKVYSLSRGNSWAANCPVGSMAWYHSGGICGSGTSDSATPEPLKQFFHTQYLGADSGSTYLTEMTLLSIISCQSVLENLNIPYQMGFIYNTQHGVQQEVEEHSHGIMDTASPLDRLVNWEKFTKFDPPYEWAKFHDLLENDQYHPTRTAMIDWLRLAMHIDLMS